MSTKPVASIVDSIRVLIIDDEESQMELTKLNLEASDSSFHITTIPKPSSALKLLSEQHFDCVVSDYQMPEMNGIQLCRKIRESNSIPFIIYTARGSEEIASEAFASGVDDYVRKETELAHYQVLAKRIRNVVEKRRVESLYRVSIDNNRDGFAIIQGLDFVLANKAMAKMLGILRPEDLIGRSILAWVAGMERDLIKDRTLNRQSGGDEPSLYEYRIKRADGETRTLEASVSLIDFMGKPASLVFNHDVTKRKLDEEALRESESRLNKSQEIAHLGSWELDLTNNQLYWSDEVYRIFGLKPQEFEATYEAFLDAVHPEDRTAVDEAYSSSLREGRDSYEINHRLIRKSTGDVRFVHEKCEHVRDKSGRIVRSIGMVQDTTEQRKAQRQMRRLASFPQLNPNPVLEVDYTGKIHYLNPFGSSEFPELIKEGSISPLLDDWEKVLTQLQDTQGNNLQRDAKVNRKWYSLSLQLIPDIERVRIYFTDITERRKMEEALKCSNEQLAAANEELVSLNEELRSSQEELQKYSASLEDKVEERIREISEVSERLGAFMEAAPDAIFIYDPNLKLIDLNRSALSLYNNGTTKQSLVGKNIKELAPGIDSTERYKAFFKVLETGESFYEEVHRVLLRFGEKWASTWAFKVGSNLGIIRRDITDLVKTQEKLRESSDYGRSLIEASLDPLVTISADGGITDVNEATIQATGATREELIGSEFADYFTDPGKAREGREKVFAEGYVRDFPLTIRHKSGKLTDVLYNAKLYRNSAGEVAGIFAAARDITERKRLENELQRTEVIAAVEQMGATVAHDLRGPLGLIVQSINMIKQDPSLTPRMHQLIEENAIRSLKMISDWRSSTRQILPQLVRIDLSGLVNRVLDGSTIPGNVEIETLIENDVDPVYLDPDIMHRVVDNLVKNAVEAMPSGGKLRVTAKKEANNLVIGVSDSGIGIPEELKGRIFSPLYTSKAGGMGLGLTYCRRAVESMGGIIDFDSQVGVGTVFSITIPLKNDSK